MEDTKVVKCHYAYMFRVDLSCNQESSSRIEQWLDINDFTHWTGCHEIGEETGKHHYQMCIWREHKLTIKEQTKARNWWRSKTLSEKNGAALTSARKILSLSSYSGKNSENEQQFSTICNLSSSQLQRIPKWQSKRAVKVEKDKRMKETVKALGNTLDAESFCKQINKIYYEIYGRCCLYKNTYINLLYQNGYLEDYQIVQQVLHLPFQDIDDVMAMRQELDYKMDKWEKQENNKICNSLGKST